MAKPTSRIDFIFSWVMISKSSRGVLQYAPTFNRIVASDDSVRMEKIQWSVGRNPCGFDTISLRVAWEKIAMTF